MQTVGNFATRNCVDSDSLHFWSMEMSKPLIDCTSQNESFVARSTFMQDLLG